MPAAKRKVGVNQTQLPFPSDPQGRTLKLKRGGIEAARRSFQNEESFKNMLETLDVLKCYVTELRDKHKGK